VTENGDLATDLIMQLNFSAVITDVEN